MNVSGTALLPGTPQQVWDLLTAPQRLVKLLPGCERLEPDGPDRYKAMIKFGLAAISGNYSGTLQLTDKNQPNSLRLSIEGKGLAGFVKGQGELVLAQTPPRSPSQNQTSVQTQTEVTYTGEAQVGGMIASVGQRMIEATAKKIIQQFFESAAKELSQTAK
ncbi:MAG TPA: carbon monoxide dehydrogenase subunit G [Candidatus Dormibacteraeota bacterium]|nr:carbon monoxide dehydrogenase subunit G [Candidatus Dormibacteraeota bacterium]